MKIGCFAFLFIVLVMIGEGESLILNKRLKPRKTTELTKSKTNRAFMESRIERKSDLISWINTYSNDCTCY